MGGKLDVVVASPEITSFKLNSGEHDFIALGCDGIFDKMSNEDVVSAVWNSVKDCKSGTLKCPPTNIHKLSGLSVEYILKNSLLRRTLDNVTVVLIAFNNFKKACFGDSPHVLSPKMATKNKYPLPGQANPRNREDQEIKDKIESFIQEQDKALTQT